MTKLPEKNVLDGSKTPKTTTGEMKDALGKLRDYLKELLGGDSADREAARLALGIDLAELDSRIDVLARNKADQSELDAKADATTLEEIRQEMAGRGVPVGSVHYFAMAEPPAGYLKADGSAVGQETYPELFAAIGTAFGEGDGESTFNLPDLIGRFPEGHVVPGTVKEAGLPNITGDMSNWGSIRSRAPQSTISFQGALYRSHTSGNVLSGDSGDIDEAYALGFNASFSNPIYGATATVQPPALTLLPCIRAFHPAVNVSIAQGT